MDWGEVLILVMKEVPVTSAGCPEPVQLCWCLQVLGRSLLTLPCLGSPARGKPWRGLFAGTASRQLRSSVCVVGDVALLLLYQFWVVFKGFPPVPLGECKPPSQGGAHEETFFSCTFC